MLGTALGACEDLGRTVNKPFDVTRAEAGQLRLDLSPLDLNTVLDQALPLPCIPPGAP